MSGKSDALMDHYELEEADAAYDAERLVAENARRSAEHQALVAERERCAEYAAEAARLRKLFDDAGQGEHNVLALIDHYQAEAAAAAEKLAAERAAERKRIAEDAAENDRLQQLLIIGRLALERERERSAKLAAENDQLRATMRAGRVPGSET